MIIKVTFPYQSIYWGCEIVEHVKKYEEISDAYDESKTFECNENGSVWYAKATNVELLESLIKEDIYNEVFTYCQGISVWDIPMPKFEKVA